MAKKKIGKVTNKSRKILEILKENPEGLRASTITKLTNYKGRTLYNHLEILQDNKLVTNVFPIWQIAKNQKSSLNMAKLLKSDKIQLHKFSFKLDLIKKPSWWDKRRNRLLRLKNFDKKPKKVSWGNVEYEQLSKSNFLIHTFPNTILFINQNKYLGEDPYTCLLEALEDTMQIYNYIEELFKFKFFLDGVPQFSISSNHFVKLKDEIANRCKKEKKLFKVHINNELRVLVDLSKPFGMEFVSKDHAPEDTNYYKNFVKDFSENKPRMLTETNDLIDKVANNQGELFENFEKYNQNIVLHLKVLKQMEKTLKNIDKWLVNKKDR